MISKTLNQEQYLLRRENLAYNPKEYWLERGKVYQRDFRRTSDFQLQEQVLMDHLKTIEFSSVLEVGCGFGRITKLVCENFQLERYLAIDLSPDQIENAKAYVQSDLVEYRVTDIQSLDDQEKFDLVLASEVLLHIVPNEILSIARKLVALAKGHLVNIDAYLDKPARELGAHNFLHNYEDIYKKIEGVNSVVRIPIVKKSFFGSSSKQSVFDCSMK